MSSCPFSLPIQNQPCLLWPGARAPPWSCALCAPLLRAWAPPPQADPWDSARPAHAVCVRVSVHKRMRVRVCVRVHVCAHVCVYACTCMCTCVHTCVHWGMLCMKWSGAVRRVHPTCQLELTRVPQHPICRLLRLHAYHSTKYVRSCARTHITAPMLQCALTPGAALATLCGSRCSDNEAVQQAPTCWGHAEDVHARTRTQAQQA